MRLTNGEKYDTDALSLVGWSDAVLAEGYDCWAYFDAEGRYLGPDADGVEPIFTEI